MYLRIDLSPIPVTAWSAKALKNRLHAQQRDNPVVTYIYLLTSARIFNFQLQHGHYIGVEFR